MYVPFSCFFLKAFSIRRFKIDRLRKTKREETFNGAKRFCRKIDFI